LSKLRERLAAGDVAAVIVLKPDRLSRVGEDILTLAKEFKRMSVRLIFVKEQWDDTPSGKMVAFALGWAGEMYVEAMKEATMRGKRKALANGKIPTGCGVGIYGYDWDKEKKRRIFNMIASGKSRIKTAQTLNKEGIPTKSRGLWHPLTINRIATNPAYYGLTIYGKTSGSKKSKSLKATRPETWKTLPDATPPIITEALFADAQKALAKTRELKNGHPDHQYLLTGHITCADCGAPMVGGCTQRIYRKYRCRASLPTATKPKSCKASDLKSDDIEAYVWDKVKRLLEKPETVLSQIANEFNSSKQPGQNSNLDRDIAQLTRKVAGYDAQKQRLLDLFVTDIFTKDELLDKMNKISMERKADEERLACLIAMQDRLNSYAEAERKLREYCGKVSRNLDNIDFEHKRLTLDALDIHVIAQKGKEPVIRWLIPIDIISASEIPHHWTNIGMTTCT
jgi:site-specific DNA recombinase